VTLPEFRRLVRKEFGANLQHITPANVREFLDRVQSPTPSPPVPGQSQRYLIEETEPTYEAILRDFLRQTLDMPSDQAVIRLWLYSLEMTVASVSEVEAEKFRQLFAELASLDGD
jgi:hypothetical protein